MKIFVHTRTIFKAEPLPASQLPTHKKIEVPAGASFIGWNNSGFSDDGHYVMYIESYLGSGENNRSDFWYIPRVHVDVFSSIARVESEGLNLRKSPNPSDSKNILQSLSQGTLIEAFDATYIKGLGLWWCVRPICEKDRQTFFNDPLIGWVADKHIEMTELDYHDL